MFGFGKKKETPPQKPNRTKRNEEFEERKAQNKAQLGFLVGLDDGGTGGGGAGIGVGSFEVDDADLENELLMLLGDSPLKPKSKSAPPIPQARARGGAPSAIKPKSGFDNFNLEDDDHEDDDDIDLDDPDLQAELGEILGDPVAPKSTVHDDDGEPPQPTTAPTMNKEQLVTLLQERLILYEKAKSNSDAANDTAKSRRFTRGIKTLKELLIKAKAGKVVDEADIPPEVSLARATKPQPTPMSIETIPIKIDAASSLVAPEVPLPDYDNVSPFPSLTNLPEPLKPTQVYRPIISEPKQPTEPPVDYNQSKAQAEPPIDYNKSLVNVEPFSPQLQPTLTPMPVDHEVESRLKEYKIMAVTLKRNQETQGALKYLKLAKALESAVSSGEPIDLSEFPLTVVPPEDVSLPTAEVTITTPPHLNPHEPESSTMESSGDNPTGLSEDIFGAPPAPKSVIEALEQRLDKYKSEVDKANISLNASKARRMGRIVKQYEEAITSFKKGKPVPFEDLPTPPGFSPIPFSPTLEALGSTSEVIQINVKSQPVPGPSSAFTDDPNSSPEKKVKPSPPGGSLIHRGGKPSTKLTLQEKQLTLITQRQKQYRDGALEAKKRGDINQAREYLRISKGFDNLIEASKSGLPVDLGTLPAPPEAISALEAEDFEVITEGDCIVPPGDLAEIYTKLEEDLKQQMKMCMRTRDHFKSIGDIASANRFESMALDTKKDLDAIRMAAKKGQEIPKYHYENKVFSITECNTDIKEDEIEINVLRGINFKGSNGLDTFVRVELPYPSAEEAQSQKSHVVKDTTDPEYNVTYKMNVNRTARNFQRFVHRHGVKFEIWSKGGICTGGLCFCGCRRGFLRSSTLLGSTTVKLQPLETKCNLHDAFDILDGRKVVGKLEVKIKLREPVLTKQITQKKEKWLSIDRV